MEEAREMLNNRGIDPSRVETERKSVTSTSNASRDSGASSGMIPYTSEDYELGWCREKAAELRKDPRYSRVRVRKKKSEAGVEFGRIFVERSRDHDPAHLEDAEHYSPGRGRWERFSMKGNGLVSIVEYRGGTSTAVVHVASSQEKAIAWCEENSDIDSHLGDETWYFAVYTLPVDARPQNDYYRDMVFLDWNGNRTPGNLPPLFGYDSKGQLKSVQEILSNEDMPAGVSR